jgi:putative membrane-bound dehydrogenase-like protein
LQDSKRSGCKPLTGCQNTRDWLLPARSRAALNLLIATVACLPFGCSQSQQELDPPPLSPSQALSSFRLGEDFRIEIFVTEPQVLSPVEMVFDENGRVYVAEMLDYPEDPPPGKPARSRIRLLEDTNGDGLMERAVVFADRVLQVSGILPWQGGLIVTSAPDILFMKDTDGDGQADVRRVLYTGFPKVNPEGRITNLRLGIDNWIYAANNGADGRITSPGHPEQPPVLVRGADFRFRPDQGLAEPASGPAQFGLTFDDWGNRFITQNTIHLRHVVIPMRYLTRAQTLNIGGVAQDISDHGRPSAAMFPLTKPQQWRVERTRLRQQRYDENQLNRTEQLSGFFTAASGSTVYTGDVFPQEYWGNVFTGDVSGNLVHRDILSPDGATFSAHRAKDGVEFLASTDVWFRPCNFANAPDGNLYLTDIYRLFIETPESIPEKLKKKMDFWAGDTKGRIYRIVPNHPLRKRDLKPRLGGATTLELVRQLESTNGWHRQTAHRLLLERQDPAAAPLLRDLAANSPLPQARIHGLWCLEGLAALDAALVMNALKDPDPHLREHALRLSEAFLAKSEPMRSAVLAMTGDPEPRVQFQLALTLGTWKDARVLDALAQLTLRRARDSWFQAAILISVADSALPFLDRLLARNPSWENAEMFSQLASLVGGKHEPAEIAHLFNILRRTQAEPGLKGLAEGLKLARVKNLRMPGAEATISTFLNHTSEAVQKAAWEVARYFESHELMRRAAAEAIAENLPANRRLLAVRALRGGAYASAGPVLRTILASTAAPPLKIAAIDSLEAFDDPAIPSTLLSSWRSYSPEVREKVLGALFSKPDWMTALLKALTDGRVERSAVGASAQARLVEHPDRELAEQARRFFSKGTDRSQVVEGYRDALNLKGDVARGKQVFELNCAKCHLPQRNRARVGPDLSGISNKTREELLASILNPSLAIDPRFVNYIVTTTDGRMYDGILANETPGAILLRGGTEEGDITLLRRTISGIRASSVSLMPDEFEKSMTRQGLADLIAYLRGGL